MSAVVNEAALAAAAPEPKPATAGACLKQARMAKGLHIAAMSVHLKVPQSKLEALEADRYQDLPDATFARALATAMCRLLKIDAAPVLALLPPSDSGTLEKVSPGLNQPFRERPSQDEAVSLDWLRRPVVWGPVLMLLAALGIHLLPDGWLQFKPSTGKTAQVAPGVAPVELPPATAAASGAVLAEAETAPAVQHVVPQAVEPTVVASGTPSVAAAPAPAATATPGVAAAPPASATLAHKPAGASALVLRAKAQTWIEITDTRGQVQFSRLMQPGEQADLDVALPAQLRIGNVAGTEVMLRGAHVDLASRAKDNVARIELN